MINEDTPFSPIIVTGKGRNDVFGEFKIEPKNSKSILIDDDKIQTDELDVNQIKLGNNFLKNIDGNLYWNNKKIN